MSNKSLDNKCPACRAVIKWNPTLNKFKCEYCDSEFTLNEMKKYNNASNENVNLGSEGDDTQYDSYKCPDCGAEIIADEHTAATFCIYCGNVAILKNKLQGKFAPTKIIPFKSTKEEAIEAFKSVTKGKILAPREFNNIKNIEKITGVYIPFWLFDFKVDGDVTVVGRKITSWIRGDVAYTKTDTYHAYRSCEMDFIKVPVDGSTKFDNDIMNSIEPFNYEELEDYNHSYLSGFFAEKYDVDWDSSFKEAQERTLNSANEVVMNDITGYNSKTTLNNNLKTNLTQKEYTLLPVWMVNVKYKNKYYIFAMNGQTKEFIGNIPIDVKKTIFYIIFVFVISYLLFILGCYMLFLMGV